MGGGVGSGGTRSTSLLLTRRDTDFKKIDRMKTNEGTALSEPCFSGRGGLPREVRDMLELAVLFDVGVDSGYALADARRKASELWKGVGRRCEM